MNPLKLSAQFAAYVWYSETRREATAPDKASRFAEENWQHFLPSAHEGWGKLLMQMAKPRRVGGDRVCRHQAGRPTKLAVAEVN
jgi:hypothetical protein